MNDLTLEIKNLTVCYRLSSGTFTAIENISIEVGQGQVVGLVGESGAGKSTVGRAVLNLIDPPGYVAKGEIYLNQQCLSDYLVQADRQASESFFQQVRGRDIGYVFQNPMTALNPVLTIGEQLLESIYANTSYTGREAVKLAIELLTQTKIKEPQQVLKKYPHQLSGGMCQRVVFAIAICAKPSLIIADEPTTALDVSVQRTVMDTLIELCRAENIAIILITHDMGVISEYCHQVYVLRHGKHVESGSTQQITHTPKMSYTQNLMAAIPQLTQRLHRFEVLEEVRPQQQQARKTLLRYFSEKTSTAPAETMLSVQNLRCEFQTKSIWSKTKIVVGVDSVSFEVKHQEILGLVGESGSGKSTIGKAILGLTPIHQGTIYYKGHELQQNLSVKLSMQCIFQDPFSSLNPRMTSGQNITYPIVVHQLLPAWLTQQDLAENLMVSVGLKAADIHKYPHEFSGGQRQRIAIARALAFRPDFIFCDEPTSALDVSVQAEILNLMKDLRDEFHLTLLFVSHDLAVIRQMCDRIIVLRDGSICETGSHDDIIHTPQHEYTQALLQAMPKF